MEKPLSVALVHNWPNAKNSELDIIIRIRKILGALGHNSLIIDPMGGILNEDGSRTNKTQFGFDLILNLHYLNPKYLDGLSYVVNWNPIDYLYNDPITKLPLPIKQMNYIVDCLRSHDRVLSAGSDIVDSYAIAARRNLKREYLPEQQLFLHTSMANPKVDNTSYSVDEHNFKVFYIGVNWEKLSTDKNKQLRHEGLFETLDKSGFFKFYGLKKQYGIPLWEGIESYCGELPFDSGDSIVQKTQECGVSLVLSSEQHRQSKLVSTRIFQACAAGSIIISDRNAFIEKHFKNSVLYFDYADTPKQTAENILNIIQWIKSNWLIAKEKAAECQQIFIQHFTLDREIETICRQANHDLESYKRYLSSLASNKIHIIYRITHYQEEHIQQFFENIKKQSIKNIRITLFLDKVFFSKIQSTISHQHIAHNIQYIDIQDFRLGECIENIQASLSADYLLIYSEGFSWSQEHIFSLLSACETNKSSIAYSPLFIENRTLKQTDDTMDFFIKGLDGGFKQTNTDKLLRFNFDEFPLGNILFHRSLLKAKDFLSDCIRQFDIGFIYILIYESFLASNKMPAFTSRITSHFIVYEHMPTNFVYNEYNFLGENVQAIKQRDRNLYSAIYRHSDFSHNNNIFKEQLISWEAEQQYGQYFNEGNVNQRLASVEKEVYRLSKEVTPFSLSPEHSKHFSLVIYLQHILRNRPILLNSINKIHQLFSRILKI